MDMMSNPDQDAAQLTRLDEALDDKLPRNVLPHDVTQSTLHSAEQDLSNEVRIRGTRSITPESPRPLRPGSHRSGIGAIRRGDLSDVDDPACCARRVKRSAERRVVESDRAHWAKVLRPCMKTRRSAVEVNMLTTVMASPHVNRTLGMASELIGQSRTKRKALVHVAASTALGTSLHPVILVWRR